MFLYFSEETCEYLVLRLYSMDEGEDPNGITGAYRSATMFFFDFLLCSGFFLASLDFAAERLKEKGR